MSKAKSTTLMPSQSNDTVWFIKKGLSAHSLLAHEMKEFFITGVCLINSNGRCHNYFPPCNLAFPHILGMYAFSYSAIKVDCPEWLSIGIGYDLEMHHLYHIFVGDTLRQQWTWSEDFSVKYTRSWMSARMRLISRLKFRVQTYFVMVLLWVTDQASRKISLTILENWCCEIASPVLFQLIH